MSAKSSVKTLLAFALAGAVCLSPLAGCKDPEKPVDTPDAGSDQVDAGGEESFDASVDAGPPPCQYDEECPSDRICNDGRCIAAQPCQDDPSTCTAYPYCDSVTGLGCRCVPSDLAPAPYNGFCKRRLPACAPCETDEQCGSDPQWFNTSLHSEARCVLMPGMDYKVCLERFTQRAKCACGQELPIDGMSFCAPQAPATCADGAFLCCTSDEECPAEHPLCDVASGLCRDSCKYDYENDETVGCPTGRVCNVDPKFLDETSPNFGAGRCARPCNADVDCKHLRSDFVCRAEGDGNKRCRPAGCIDSFECAETGDENPHKSFCERSSGRCICDGSDPASVCFCRQGEAAIDPVTGEQLKDCKAGFKCEHAACVEQNCIEQGGAELACGWHQFCCGDDRNGNGRADDPCTNEVGIELATEGQCYAAPNPPWCRGCESDADCEEGAPTSSALDRHLCVQGQCVYACALLTECPRGYGCDDLRVGCNEDPSVCGDPSRCADSGMVDMEGNPIKYCSCTNPGVRGGECPGTGSSASRCDDAGSWCIWTRGCVPGPNNCQLQ
jgi:hypothetical protein